MLGSLGKWALLHQKIMVAKRYMTTTEVSAALRPFYFSVHPDLFGQYPTERAINENSLKQLSSFLECLQSKKAATPCHLQFYLRDKSVVQSSMRLIDIYLNEKDMRATILTVLKCCDLPTEYVDKIPEASTPKRKKVDFTRMSENTDFSKLENDPIFGAFIVNNKVRDARYSFTLKRWLKKNRQLAVDLNGIHTSLQGDVARLKKIICDKLFLTDIRWECGWNEQHFKGCLLSLQELTEQHPDIVHVLKGRVIVFAPFTGVSLDGYIMLNSAEVRHNWLELMKNVDKYDAAFRRIPGFEKALSQVLRNMRVVRRKFMPKILAGEYENNLQHVTTALSDYLGRRSYPSEWPQSLENYKIVIETEAGPLMVSPTGLFIVPCSYPSVLLVKFISEQIQLAAKRMLEYKSIIEQPAITQTDDSIMDMTTYPGGSQSTNLEQHNNNSNNNNEIDLGTDILNEIIEQPRRNKQIEQILHKQCTEELQLISLHKDDNVTPDLMIQCCERLLEHKNDLNYVQGVHLYITNYYSVLRDGVMCIPWNWNL